MLPQAVQALGCTDIDVFERDRNAEIKSDLGDHWFNLITDGATVQVIVLYRNRDSGACARTGEQPGQEEKQAYQYRPGANVRCSEPIQSIQDRLLPDSQAAYMMWIISYRFSSASSRSSILGQYR